MKRKSRASARSSCDYKSLEPRQLLAALTVTNTNDAGAGSLRQAIETSNFTGGVQEICFQLPGDSDRRIELQTALPEIFDEVHIYGHTQPGFDFGDVVIEVDGSDIVDADVDGLLITASRTEIFGLAMVGFSDDGIEVRADEVVIGHNYFGIDLDGVEKANGRNGLRLKDAGESEVFSNVISGNDFAGVMIVGDSSNNGIYGNTIGTNVGQTDAIPNFIGVLNRSRSNGIINNVIAGNESSGISLTNAAASGSESTVHGNHIGVTPAGIEIANQASGMFVLSSNNSIGGSLPGQGNVVSGNTQHGIMLQGGTGNVVEGNHIGLTADDVEMGNGFVGLRVIGSADLVVRSNIISGNDSIGVFVGGAFTTDALFELNMIGTDTEGSVDIGNKGVGFILNGSPGALIQGNVISGNDKGGFSSVVGDTNYRFISNMIGTDHTGTRRLNNSNHGMFVFSNKNQIGEAGAGNIFSDSNLGLVVGAGSENTIAHNIFGTDSQQRYDLGMNYGIYFFQGGSSNVVADNTIHHVLTGIRNTSSGQDNTFARNEFYNTSFLGIDNAAPGFQNGANTSGVHMAPPVMLDRTLVSASVLELTYSVPTDASRVPATIEFFIANYNGSGRQYIGMDIFTVDDLGSDKSITLDVTGIMGLFLNSKIVATATDADGNTSEFGLMI